MQVPVNPFSLTYDGLDADQHRGDALLIGQSLQGTARVYNSLINFHFAGKYVSPKFHSIRTYIGPTQEGSLFYLLYLLMVHGKLAVYPEIFFELASLAVPKLLKAVIARRSGQTQLVEKMVDQMHDMYVRHDELAKANAELAKMMHTDGHSMQVQMFGLIEKLALNNKKPLADMAAPIGRTVRQIEHFKGTPESVVVDEPTGEALRSKEEAVVGDLTKFRGKFMAVDKLTGASKLLLEGEVDAVRAKITDPALAVAENVYTHALDTEQLVVVDAKPVTKDGEVSTLYISDAKIIG